MQHKQKNEFGCTALLLQGGGALGAYQGGVYEALCEAQLEPDWVAGISIGAFNAAIIAGNAPEDRLAKLREFWEGITTDDFHYTPPMLMSLLKKNDDEHQLINVMSAMRALTLGIPGFFRPRIFNPWLARDGSPEAISFYDSSPLHSMLKKVVDFDRLNSGEMRFNVGAVNVTTGNFINFDAKEIEITPRHVMASGALPPSLPPVEIDGEYYWDGGIISNTPLQWLLNNKTPCDTLVFQIDLWSAEGEFPKNMAQVLTRKKDIRYSSRTRANTERLLDQHKLAHALAELLEQLPDKLKDSPSARLLKQYSESKAYNIVHLIYHNKDYEGYSKDFEFSRCSMKAHWKAGYEDTMHTLSHPEILKIPKTLDGIGIFDFNGDKKSNGKRALQDAA